MVITFQFNPMFAWVTRNQYLDNLIKHSKFLARNQRENRENCYICFLIPRRNYLFISEGEKTINQVGGHEPLDTTLFVESGFISDRALRIANL